jgi:general secretion pathway protein J
MHYGFTLVEITIALTLLSMIMLLLFGSLHTANRSWQSGVMKVEQNDELRLIGHFIRRQIAQTMPLVWVNREGRRLVFHGEQDELTFTSTLPSYRGDGGLYFMTLKVDDSGGSKQLALIYRRATPEVSPFTTDFFDEQTRVLLIENIEAIEFAYYGNENPGDNPRWHDSWQHDDMLPKLVRLKVHSYDPGRNWPVINLAIPSTPVVGQPLIIRQDNLESPIT